MRGMTQRRQHRWFLTRRAVDELYVTRHRHPSPREEARAAGLAQSHPHGELPQDFQDRFALGHDHSVHLESQDNSLFAAADPVEDDSSSDNGSLDHEHPPWTATSRGWRCPCDGWPCWNQSTPWPRTCYAAEGWSGRTTTWRLDRTQVALHCRR